MSDDAMKFFRLFRDVCRAIHSSLNVNEVLNLITKNTVTLLNTKACKIFLLNKVDKTLWLVIGEFLARGKKKCDVDMVYKQKIS